MSFLTDAVAVVTGAGSGMGRSLAQQLAAKGAALALADVKDDGLDATIELLRGAHRKVTKHIVNVADESQVQSFAAAVEREHGRATILFNNAGVALLGHLDEISLDQFRWLMDINFWGVVYGCTHFLPLLKREKRAHIVNTSSLLGLFGAAGQGAYCASKFAVRGYTESLHHELLGTSVGVTCVHPGFVRTAIAESARVGQRAGANLRQQSLARYEKVVRTDAPTAAAKILRAVELGKSRVLIGPDAYFVDLWQRLKPAGYWNLIARQFEDPGNPGHV
ncbi:MAG TPA: SDR family NAD(P)-dependent oxidoreductase [Dongiaceae bacterium]|nr:SDR family NAD(P)-dependent oxidoreductase [Methylomirabilota bacterium]HVO56306.1 SDR family NAD(P)-dependent oxidoreductase [Dongiaceae bacterium]